MAGRVAILIDDMIDTAGTLVAGAQVVRDHGATRVFAAATHGLLSGPAVKRLRESVIEEVVDHRHRAAARRTPRMASGSCRSPGSWPTPIHNVFCDESVSEIFAGENQLF